MSAYLIAHIGHTTKWCEHVTWWKPESCGYTICIEKAGVYTEAEARSICQYGSCIAVTKECAEELAHGTPYYRQSAGTLAKMYDGSPHNVVPNGKTEWAKLMDSRLGCGKAEKPTPIGAKARAIYLPNNAVTNRGVA